MSLIWHHFPALLPEFDGMTLELMADALMKEPNFYKLAIAMAKVKKLHTEQREMFEKALRQRGSDVSENGCSLRAAANLSQRDFEYIGRKICENFGVDFNSLNVATLPRDWHWY